MNMSNPHQLLCWLKHIVVSLQFLWYNKPWYLQDYWTYIIIDDIINRWIFLWFGNLRPHRPCKPRVDLEKEIWKPLQATPICLWMQVFGNRSPGGALYWRFSGKFWETTSPFRPLKKVKELHILVLPDSTLVATLCTHLYPSSCLVTPPSQSKIIHIAHRFE